MDELLHDLTTNRRLQSYGINFSTFGYVSYGVSDKAPNGASPLTAAAP